MVVDNYEIGYLYSGSVTVCAPDLRSQNTGRAFDRRVGDAKIGKGGDSDAVDFEPHVLKMDQLGLVVSYNSVGAYQPKRSRILCANLTTACNGL